MVYLDYSATTPVNDLVLDSFNSACKNYIGNPNSLHKLGVNSKHLIELSSNQILNLLNVSDKEVIYTSGASESNNLAIKGVAYTYKNRGNHIITTKLEHSSIKEPLEFLKKEGYKVSYTKLDDKGLVDINYLKQIITDDTILVSVTAVNSELGIRENIEEIGKLLRDYPKCYFHVDMTQAIGKEIIDLKDVDLFSFSAHKFYGIKGVGALIKNKKLNIEPLIHGGKSTTIYRSGTPSLPLIVSLAKSLRLSLEHINDNINYVKTINDDLKKFFSNYDKVHINSLDNCIPHILNISIIGVKPETFLHALEQYEIYVSTKSACSSNGTMSDAVYEITNNIEYASSSIRISLSHITTLEEIDKLKECFDKCYTNLTSLKK